MTVTKNMSNGFQFIAGFNRQWHKMDGTWNPTDPARFVQPDHFANNANLYMPRGNNDDNSLPDTGNALSYGPTWMRYRGNFGARLAGAVGSSTWPATSRSRRDRGRDRRCISWRPTIPTCSSTDRRRSRSRTERPQPNPLATRNRYVFSDRGEGQVRAPTINTVGLKVGKVLK